METSEAPEAGDSVWPHAGAYVLLSGGLTMVFLAASTLMSAPAVATPALIAPLLVAVGLATQRPKPLSGYLGDGIRVDVTALAAVFGPFVIVLAMVLAAEPRTIDASWASVWTVVLAALAELGWWGYLYHLLRERLQPLPSAFVIGIVQLLWYGLLGWADVNPLAGASPTLLGTWTIVLAILTAAILEFQPWSLVPVVLLHLGVHTAIELLPFAPVEAGTSRPMSIGVVLLLIFGLVAMVWARSEAVTRARHARTSR